ncbi:MAG: 2-hydroxyacyl-CoA dehydratase [Candidatus Cloacimonetes bacterium]|jgi:benzoyl-CoA reductase/2-hydroxyglutaryl-CoA dehydratase subunit BcrC/BadD/HgdB|nr:2-hydroxyacyl-CoA dehydratase [Candidatus Cloacimonadota bacterium]MBT6993841.1 2-hydroxyacyl-CoA dehydratase [Candidatus Cloacimonadota bacterium]MBT7469580.1 2-hydroxyacyl-CoA dehydratase [Candidatus Cloacimonadota bacterium]
MKIGFTTSFPVEIAFAAGHTPLDLNNIFVTQNAKKLVEKAEFDGYPRNVCSWIKGMYSVILEAEIDAVVGVVEGDCSNTHSLTSTLIDKGIKVISFSFPHAKNREKLEDEIFKLETYFKVKHTAVLKVKKRLDEIRKKLIYLDELTYLQNKVSGLENHFWLVNSSDFNGNPDDFEKRLDDFLAKAEKRTPLKSDFRFGFLGVPPIISDLYDFLSENKINVVFNEIQRQFSMPFLAKSLTDQYLQYTYPYSIFDRLEDIQQEIKARKLDAVISYSQAFCHRQIDNILIKKYVDVPLLTIEGDQPGQLDARTKLRIESFLDMLRY